MTRVKTSLAIIPSLWRSFQDAADALNLSYSEAIDDAIVFWLDQRAVDVAAALRRKADAIEDSAKKRRPGRSSQSAA